MNKLKLKSVTINYGRKGTWYEDAQGKSFRVVSSILHDNSLAPKEIVVDLDGHLDGLFGINPKTALLTDSCCDYTVIYGGTR